MENLEVRALDLPELPDYITVSQASRILGISDVMVRRKVYEQKKLTAFRVGDADQRPILLLIRAEVEELAEQEKAHPSRQREAASRHPQRPNS